MRQTSRSTTLGLVGALALLALGAGEAGAQATGTVTGQVLDATTRRPLASAQVYVPGTGVGTITNDAGRFLLVNVPAGEQTLQVELIGYESASRTVDVRAGQSVTLEIALGQQAISLEGVVVTGVGQATERRRLGAVVDVISSQEIESAPVTSVDQLLQGRVPGGTVNLQSSQPGTAALINFRGVSSVFGAQTPVIYVDGVRVDNNQATAAGTGGEQSSALADLLASDIDRIEITKGGAASTLFGSDAATGVIQIFTKQGRPGDTRIVARTDQAILTPDLKYMFDAGVIFPDIVEAGEAPATFLEDNFFRTGHLQNYYLGVSGGSSDVTYNVSGRIEQSDGIQPKNDHVLYNLRGSVEAQVNEDFQLRFMGSYTRSDFERLFNGAAIADPLTTFEVGDALFFSGTDNLFDALDVFLMPDITEEVDRFIFSSRADYAVSDRVRARLSLGLDNRGNHQRVFEPIGFVPGEITGELTRWQREFTSVSLDAAVTYSWPQSGVITSDFTVGAQGFRDDESVIVGNGTTFALPGAPDFDEAATIDASESNTELFNGGIYLDEQLGWRDRVFLGLGLRLDAGSTFGEDVDLQAYPKATLAYLLSEEDFFPGIGFLDLLRVRAAYGETGKFPEPFDKDRSFSAISFRGESAPRFDNPGNQELGPEVTETFEAGFDAGFLQNRLGFSLTYFDATTEDALFFVPEQPATGLGTQLRNVGTISNEGWELEANARLVSRENLTWSVGATFNTVENRVTSMGGASPFFVEPQKHVAPGAPVGAWFVTTPFDSNGDGLPDASRREYIKVGGTCSEAEITGQAEEISDDCELASAQPTKFGTVSTSFTFGRRLSLSLLGDWAGGHHVMDWGSVWATFNGIFRREEIEGVPFPTRFTLDGEEDRKYPQSAARSAFIYDGDWFKLREIAASYDLPSEWVGGFGAQGARLYGSVRNVWTSSENALIDPELNGLSGGGLALGSESSITMSPPRTYRLGVELVF